jgi:hypothetical protein
MQKAEIIDGFKFQRVEVDSPVVIVTEVSTGTTSTITVPPALDRAANFARQRDNAERTLRRIDAFEQFLRGRP